MKKNLLITKRIKAKELKEQGWSIRKIARNLVACKNNVSKWVKMSEEELMLDNRGWDKGRLRKYTTDTEIKVKNIRIQLETEDSYFLGSKVVKLNYEDQYGKNISKWFVDNTLKKFGMVKTPQLTKKGKSKYMQYPKQTLNKLGRSMMSIDFIGPKYLKGSDKRINFLSCKYIRPSKEGIVKRVSGQTTEQVIEILQDVWKTYPVPEVLKMDNDSAFGGNLSHKRCIGKFTVLLLNLGVKPLYIAPRSPWNNGEVEGFNSVFSKKFWNKLQFNDEQEIDIKIIDFNVAYKKYSGLIANNPPIKQPLFISDFKEVNFENKQISKFAETKIYLLRIVRRRGDKDQANEYGFIDILGEEIKISNDLINLFVYCILDLKKSELIINIENESGQLIEVKRKKFRVENIEK